MAKKKNPTHDSRLHQPFTITSVCRTDLINSASVSYTQQKRLSLTDAQMTKMASKMADHHVSELFYTSLSLIELNLEDES